MTSISGTGSSTDILQEVKLAQLKAQQEALSALNLSTTDGTSATDSVSSTQATNTGTSSDSTSSGTTSDVASMFPALNSNGNNTSAGSMSALASALGVDPTTLAAQLQGNTGGLSSLVASSSTDDSDSSASTANLQSLISMLGTSGTMFDGKL